MDEFIRKINWFTVIYALIVAAFLAGLFLGMVL